MIKIVLMMKRTGLSYKQEIHTLTRNAYADADADADAICILILVKSMMLLHLLTLCALQFSALLRMT